MLRKYLVGVVLAFLSSAAIAHEMTPTYPKLEPSHLDNVMKSRMQIFNKRADVEYYEVGVFDKDFNPIPFVTSYQVMKIDYLGHVTFDVYIRKADAERAEYICSRSKLRKDDSVRTTVSSRICSKIK